MHLRQTLGLPAKAPAPPVAGFFDPAQEIRRDELIAVRVTVGQPHNTLAVADQFPKPTPIERRIPPFSAMNLRQVACQSYRPLSILLPEPSAFGQSFQIEMIAGPLRPLGQDEKFARLGHRDQLPIVGKGPDIESLHVARQPAIGVIIPEDRLCPIRRMLMTERPRTHRLQHRRPDCASDLKGQFDGGTIPILFVSALRTFLSNDPIGQQGRCGTEPVAKVSFQGLFPECGHCAVLTIRNSCSITEDEVQASSGAH